MCVFDHSITGFSDACFRVYQNDFSAKVIIPVGNHLTALIQRIKYFQEIVIVNHPQADTPEWLTYYFTAFVNLSEKFVNILKFEKINEHLVFFTKVRQDDFKEIHEDGLQVMREEVWEEANTSRLVAHLEMVVHIEPIVHIEASHGGFFQSKSGRFLNAICLYFVVDSALKERVIFLGPMDCNEAAFTIKVISKRAWQARLDAF